MTRPCARRKPTRTFPPSHQSHPLQYPPATKITRHETLSCEKKLNTFLVLYPEVEYLVEQSLDINSSANKEVAKGERNQREGDGRGQISPPILGQQLLCLSSSRFLLPLSLRSFPFPSSIIGTKYLHQSRDSN